VAPAAAGPERVGEDIHAPRQGQRVRQAHPVQGAVRRAVRRVEVIVAVGIQQPRGAGLQVPQRRHDPEGTVQLPPSTSAKSPRASTGPSRPASWRSDSAAGPTFWASGCCRSGFHT
jgi:hypothetical protein